MLWWEAGSHTRSGGQSWKAQGAQDHVEIKVMTVPTVTHN